MTEWNQTNFEGPPRIPRHQSSPSPVPPSPPPPLPPPHHLFQRTDSPAPLAFDPKMQFSSLQMPVFALPSPPATKAVVSPTFLMPPPSFHHSSPPATPFALGDLGLNQPGVSPFVMTTAQHPSLATTVRVTLPPARSLLASVSPLSAPHFPLAPLRQPHNQRPSIDSRLPQGNPPDNWPPNRSVAMESKPSTGFPSRSIPRSPGVVHVFGQDNLASPFSSHSRSYQALPDDSHKPLKTVVFYLDLEDQKQIASLKGQITHLGGTIEKFFSRKVTHVISTRAERAAEISITVSPPSHSKVTFPPAGVAATKPEISPGQFEKSQLSHLLDLQSQPGQRKISLPRGKAAVKVPNNPNLPNENDVLVQAQKFGMKIWSVDSEPLFILLSLRFVNNPSVFLLLPELTSYMKRYIRIPDNAPGYIFQSLAQERRSSQVPRGRDPANIFTTIHPMVVVEDQAGTFKPVFKEFPPGRRGKSSFPAMNFEAPPGICPLYPQHVIDEKNAGKLKAHRERETARRFEEREAFNALPPVEKIARARKKGPKAGYCECCRIDYTDVNKVRPS